MHECTLDLPEAEIFCLQDAVFIVHTPDPARPRPPKPTCSAEGARALMALRPLVERVLRRWQVPAADVPDVTQKVLLGVLDWWARRGPAPTAGDLEEAQAYLAVAARHAAHTHQRRRRRRSEAAAGGPTGLLGRRGRSEEAQAPSPEELALAEEARSDLAAEVQLDALAGATSPAAWRAFYAHAVLDIEVELIADSERVPRATIYSRLRLAREDLRAFLHRRRAGRSAR